MSTEAGIDVQRQLESLVQDFRTSDPPMPVIVLHAEDPADDDRVTELVDELREGQRQHGMRLAVASTEPQPRSQPGNSSPTARAAQLVRDLGDSRKWGDRSAAYRPYSFPRLSLVRALQEATDDPEMREHWPTAPAGTPEGNAQRERARAQLLRILARQRWRPRRPPRRQILLTDVQQFLPMGVLGAFTALLTRPEWYIAVLAGIGLMVLLAVLNHVPGRAPLFLWLRGESRWFLTTTFLQSAARRQSTSVRLLRPVHSWKAIAARAYDVAEAMREGGPFPLQLYVLALLEDLRSNHRRGSWDLRGFKRTRPPVLFLRRTGRENGGIELIKAVSDVRSRRSELDPLLIVAGVAADDAPLLDRGADGSPQVSPSPSRYQPSRLQQRLRNWYDEWAGNLRADQSPSRTNALPWVLRIPLPREELVQLRETDRRCVRAGHRLPLVRVVWSAYSLALALVLVCTAGGVHSYELHRTYCSAGLLTANRDTERYSAPGTGTECVGIATGDVRFGAYLRDTGDEEADEQGERLRELENRIHDENARVLRNHSGTHVTVVYAGPLSSSKVNPSPVKGVEELTGVYLAQRVVNENHTVKMRVLLANGGADMGHQRETAEAIAAYAERDPTFVGVVGFGRDLQSSPDVTDRLHTAEVPIVSGTNSASYLPKEFSNWFSLAVPDEHQAEALGHVARQLRTPGRATYALVLARDLKGSQDRYTSEQAAYGGEMLERERFRMLPTQEYRVVNGDPELRLHAERICQGENVPSVIYFAGRVEDVGPLMTQLSTQPGCADQEISILTGDDLSKARFSGTGGSDGVAPQITLYHAALAELEDAAPSTAFYEDAARHLTWIEQDRLPYTSPDFASGQTALSHDATRALYWAASREDVPQSRAATWVNLRSVKLDRMATGTIDFTDAPLYGERHGHSILIKRVRRTPAGVSEAEVLCSRTAGDIKPLDVKECPIK
ncbi:ABC transporter substrate-binding protein [Streptomyces sp. NBC_01635]|uniref:ABC transporter substrate-binding protein n=1 Tax=Streptomyces sp. NBC_01635 TaxID=2975904 RepID=UPI0038689144|nr:ABC transporter substrate-binding protein [Streptomyces sp. NBC_01635]